MACLANLFLGIPTRILMRITRFKAENFNTFEKSIAGVDWELFLAPGPLPQIRASARKSRLYHTDALAERCREVLKGQIPAGAGQAQAPQTLMVRGENDVFDISLDMSGLPLYKRGLKQAVVRAPLRETQAHAVLSQLGFGPDHLLVDPMTGSGTFSLEGAMIQSGIPPGFFRSFAFEGWPGFQPARFDHAKTKIQESVSLSRVPTIFASDLDPAAVDTLARTAASREFLTRISVQCLDLFDTLPPEINPENGVLVLNPPYGKRLGKEMDIHQFYREIGKKLSRDYRGWQAAIICPSPALFKALHLPLSPMPLFHGGLDIAAAVGRLP